MDLITLFTLCAEKKIQLSLDNDQLKITAPKGALTPELVAQLKEHKAQIMAFLAKAPNDSHWRAEAIRLVDRHQPIAASYGQEQLWFIHNIADLGDSYHFARVIHCKGALDVVALKQSFNKIVERHEPLRTVFTQIDGILHQTPLHTELAIPFFDLRDQAIETRQVTTDQLIQQLYKTPFDFANDLMIRVQVFQLAEDNYKIAIVLQHIATDGWSLGLLIKELQQLYQGYTTGQEAELPSLSAQYADYSVWQRELANTTRMQESLAYWQTQLAGAPEIHTLPTDHPRPAHLSHAGASLYRTLDAKTLDNLKQLARDSGITLFMLLESLFALLLFRYSQNRDIILGTPVANRDHRDVENLIGYFVNMIALRHQIDPTQRFTEFLQANKKMLVAAFSHQQVPFETIVRNVQHQRSLSHNPIIQLGFSFQNNEIPPLRLAGLDCAIAEPLRAVAQLDLNLDITETGQGLALHWCYATDLFEQTTVARMATHFTALIESALAQPTTSIADLDFFSAQEQQQFLREWNSTCESYPQEKCIHEFFEQQATANPNHVALIFNHQQLSYNELNARANQLARFLVSTRGITPDTLVGLCLERSPDMLVAILGILKAGGAYVPMDPAYPPARLSYMLQDAKLHTVITQADLASLISLAPQQAVLLDDERTRQQLANYPTTNLRNADQGLTSRNLAYVLYTSGSTGNPKGVMVEHKNVANFLHTMAQAPGLTEADRLLAVTSTSFDIHGLELFLPLFAGAQIVLAARTDVTDPARLNQLIDAHSISVMQATPATWKMLLEANWMPANPIKILCGGEALSTQLAEDLLRRPQLQLWNMYGPTETTIWSCVKRILPDDHRISMGKPIANTQVYVVSEANRLVPIGTAGELLIGGDGVTRGYLNRADLTAEKFVDNPFPALATGSTTTKVYKTGDLVRWLPNGELEYISRMDHQVKIRGFRIELGEIENLLLQQAGIKDAVVLAKDANGGDKRLVAYLVMAAGQHPATTDQHQLLIQNLRQSLATGLPDYMVPNVFMLLDALPLTPNGKVDRKALPEPDLNQEARPYTAPCSTQEQMLCAIWEEVLGSGRIGIDDNFFLSGGDSLKAVRLVGKARAAGFDHNLTQLYAMTIRELATLWSEPEETGTRQLILGPIPLSSAQIWFFSTIKINPGKCDISSLFRFTNLDIGSLHKALVSAVHCHDNLRATFHTNNLGETIQVLVHPDEAVPGIQQHDISALDEPGQRHFINDMLTSDVAAGVDLAHAPLLRVKAFYLGNAQSAVRFSIHHAVVDEFSLHILMEDIINLYHAFSNGISYNLPKASISLPEWINTLRARSNSLELLQEADYWHGLPWENFNPFPTSWPETAETVQLAGFTQHSYRLSHTQTETLLAFSQREKIPVINLLITTISLTLAEYNQGTAQLLKVIDSARDMDAGVDLSRTAGWLAISRIMLLSLEDLDFDYQNIQMLHQQMIGQPNKGLGFELLQRYSNSHEVRDRFNAYPKPEILINYRGHVEADTASGDALLDSFNHLRTALPQFDPANISHEKFIFTAAIANGQLDITWQYNARLFEHDVMSEIAGRIMDKLSRVGDIAKPARTRLAQLEFPV